eukprot:363328-Chlamydomonas_euryale.AAC.9
MQQHVDFKMRMSCLHAAKLACSTAFSTAVASTSVRVPPKRPTCEHEELSDTFDAVHSPTLIGTQKACTHYSRLGLQGIGNPSHIRRRCGWQQRQPKDACAWVGRALVDALSLAFPLRLVDRQAIGDV